MHLHKEVSSKPDPKTREAGKRKDSPDTQNLVHSWTLRGSKRKAEVNGLPPNLEADLEDATLVGPGCLRFFEATPYRYMFMTQDLKFGDAKKRATPKRSEHKRTNSRGERTRRKLRIFYCGAFCKFTTQDRHMDIFLRFWCEVSKGTPWLQSHGFLQP